jgi:hypothetical protein
MKPKHHPCIHNGHATYASLEQAAAAAKLYRHDRKVSGLRHTPTASDLHVGFVHATTSAAFLEAFKLWEKRDAPVPNVCDVCSKPAYPADDGPETEEAGEAKASMCAWPHAEDEERHVACRNRVCLECAKKPHPQCADLARGRYCLTHSTPENHILSNGEGVRSFIN